jgi:serine/threonine protein kinase
VYLARGRTVSGPQQFFALKEIAMKNKDWLEDVVNEIKILRGLRHENILVLREAFYSDSDPRKAYLVTLPWAPQSLQNFFWDLLKGKTLHSYQWFLPGYVKPWPSIILQCSEGLAYLHLKGVKHKDLKPENILLLQETNPLGTIRIRPIIADFGLSKTFEHGGNTDNRGTTVFKAPEQFVPNLPSELHSDIWSLGCCFACVWIFLYSGTEGLRGFWTKVIDSKPDERGFHTEANTKATHELLAKPSARPENPSLITHWTYRRDVGLSGQNDAPC